MKTEDWTWADPTGRKGIYRRPNFGHKLTPGRVYEIQRKVSTNGDPNPTIEVINDDGRPVWVTISRFDLLEETS